MSGLLSGLWKPNTKGLYTGPLDGLNAFNVSASAPTPIAVWDWTPTTYAGVDPAGTATYRWDMQDTSGDLTEDIVGGGTHDLAEVSAGPNLLGQTAAGISNGSNLSGRKCIEGVPGAANSNRYHSKSTTTLNPSDGSVAIRCVFRIPDGSLTALSGRHMLGTWETTSLGFFVSVSYPTGAVMLGLDDGPTYVTASASGDHADGAWHCVEAIVDWTNDEIRIRTDLDPTGATASIAAAVQANTNIDARFSVLGSEHRGSIINLQIADLYGWEGSAAESIDSTAWSEVWPYFADPLAGTAFEDDTISYTGVVAVPTSGEDKTFYLCSGDAGQYPVGYDARFVNNLSLPNGFARWEQPSMTNLVAESEHLETGWTATNATVSAAAADLADNRLGFRAARKITASAANGYIESPSITVVNTAQHQLYCWVAGNGGTVTGRLIAYDNSGAAETGSTAFSAGDGVWTLVKFEFTAASTDYRIRIEVDNNTEAINCCHVTLFDWDTQAHSYWGCPIPTYGASSTTDEVNGQANLSSSEWTEARGTLLISSIAGATDSFHQHQSSISGNDAFVARFRSGGAWQLSSRTDGAGAQVSGSAGIGGMVSMTATDPILWHYVWDSAAPIDTGVYDRQYWKDGTSTDSRDGNTTGWTAGDGFTGFRYGNGVESGHLMGFRGYGAVYDQPYLDGEL